METGNLTIDAQAAFARQRRRSRLERLARWARRSCDADRLPCLDQAMAVRVNRRTLGLQEVALASIQGTTEPAKANAFDRVFRPSSASRGRWERLWIAGRRGASLPPVSLVRLGDRHFVDDGHHRVSVARALGMAAIDAEVVELSSRWAHPGSPLDNPPYDN
jgi:hypothetical protein